MILFASSCSLFTAKQPFANQNDSIQFAKEVIAKYPNISRTAVVTFARKDTLTPIDWSVVNRYKDNYEDSPLLKRPDGMPYRGFLIDSAAYELLVKKHNRYKQLYLRLGRNSNAEYTIMILPMAGDSIIYKGKRNVNKGDADNNYDHLDPCPDQCPTNFDQNP